MKNNTIVMIHGLLGSLHFFSPQNSLPEMSVYTPDLIGYGSLDNQDNIESLSLQDQVDFVKRLVAEEIKKPCWLLGHSVGGAIAMMFAAQNHQLVKGIINVEGNFTLNDAFWSEKISQLPLDVWRLEYQEMRARPEKWLLDAGISPTPERIVWAEQILNYQPASTVQAVAKAVVRDTASTEYLQAVERVVEQKSPLYLLAGERSKDDWDVPKLIRDTAVQSIVQPQVGHMMMLEEPKAFCEIVRDIVEQKGRRIL
ncbi:MAG: alpha/beta hydrolase [Acidobacteriota bacterium]